MKKRIQQKEEREPSVPERMKEVEQHLGALAVAASMDGNDVGREASISR